MSISVTLYRITDDPRLLQKNLTGNNIKTVTAIPYDSINIFRPTFILDYDDINDLKQANYLTAMDRFYFITLIYIDTAQRIVIECKEDVLMSFQNEILSKSCIVDRTAVKSLGRHYLPDNEMLTQADSWIQDIIFAGPTFNDYSQILINIIT